MLEINRSFELTEMKKPTADGFKCIEPQSKNIGTASSIKKTTQSSMAAEAMKT